MIKPRAQFPPKLRFLFRPARYKVLYGGRGGAKSWGIARALLVEGARRTMRIVCARETQKSIQDSVHALLSDQTANLGLSKFYEVQKATLLGRNGTQFIFVGLKHNPENIKSLEGADVVWVEEAQNVSKASWEIVIPTVRKPNSEIWASFNPELDTDDTYKRFVVNPPPGAIVIKIGWQDNPWFPEVLRIEKDHLKLIDPVAYEHVWEGATRSSVEGAVFGDEVKDAQFAVPSRITNVPLDRTKPVDTFWDLGYGDKTAIWFGQAVEGWYHFVDYLEDSGRTIEWYLIQLQQRGYLYGNDWMPHDALDVQMHRNLGGDRSRSIEGIMRAAGRSVRMVPKMYVTDRINAARSIFPQCRFDADKCYEGLRALRMYQWGPKPASGVLKREPLHDDASHGADSFTYAALALKQPRNPPPSKKPSAPYTGTAWS